MWAFSVTAFIEFMSLEWEVKDLAGVDGTVPVSTEVEAGPGQ